MDDEGIAQLEIARADVGKAELRWTHYLSRKAFPSDARSLAVWRGTG